MMSVTACFLQFEQNYPPSTEFRCILCRMRMSDGKPIGSWEEYRSRKNLALILTVGMILVAAGGKFALLHWAQRLIMDRPKLAMICWFVLFFIAFVASFVAVVRFWLWKCPRCGSRFIGIYDAFAFFRRRCFFCHLPIGSDPASSA